MPTTTIETLFLALPNEAWHYTGLSSNIGITSMSIKAYPNKPWDPSVFNSSRRKYLKRTALGLYEEALEEQRTPYAKKIQIRTYPRNNNPQSSLDVFVTRTPFKDPPPASTYKSLKRSDQEELQWNNKVTPEYIVEAGGEWDYKRLSLNPNITPKFIADTYHEKWEFEMLSYHENMTEEFIEDNIDEPWDWESLSANKAITPAFIARHPGRPWVFGAEGLSRNPSITHEFFESNLNEKWDWRVLSQNPGVTASMVLEHHNKPWNFGMDGLSSNMFELHPFILFKTKPIK